MSVWEGWCWLDTGNKSSVDTLCELMLLSCSSSEGWSTPVGVCGESSLLVIALLERSERYGRTEGRLYVAR